jgi:phosphohistidine phosphatase
MDVYLIRHAQSQPLSLDEPDDVRWLTSSGRATAREVGKRLAAAGVRVDAVLTSPLVRAAQTAELVVQGLGFMSEVESMSDLAVGGSVRSVAAHLPTIGASLLVVGHSPDLSKLGSLLCERASFPAFRTGEVAAIRGGALAWMMSPDTFELRGPEEL